MAVICNIGEQIFTIDSSECKIHESEKKMICPAYECGWKNRISLFFNMILFGKVLTKHIARKNEIGRDDYLFAMYLDRS